jgi:hypothetical protein
MGDMDMNKERRKFLKGAMPAMIAAELLWHGNDSRAQDPQRPGPRPPFGQLAPPEEGPKFDNKKILKHNQEQIQQDVERLYTLAQQLKEQVEKTDSAEVLSLSLVQKADEVERLAHHIRSLAKG